MEQKLETALNEIIEKNTLSLVAVDAVKKLRDENNKLANELDYNNKRLEQNKLDTVTLEARNDHLLNEIEGWKSREDNIKERESKVIIMEKNEAVAKAKADTLGHCFDTVFRNTIFRESFNKIVPNGVDQYGNSQTACESGDVEKSTDAEKK